MAYPISDPFVRLTWDDAERWAGAAVVERGRSYQRLGAVSGLARSQEGHLLAWVQGTRRYATRVGIQARKQLASECTCPYWTDCKHGVATVLAYLQAVKQGLPVPPAPSNDMRLEALAEHAADLEALEGLDFFTGDSQPDRVPGRGLGFWKAKAESHIASGQIKGYEAAGLYLEKIRDALAGAGRQRQWQQYLAALKAQNKRRSRCLEVLDRVGGHSRRIIDS